MMADFWPSGLKLDDTQSPMQILKEAQQDWETKSDGLLTLVLQNATSESGNDLILVHAQHVSSKRTSHLFSVIHRPKSPYPATIEPRDSALPNVLKKSYYQPGILGPAAAIRSLDKPEGRTVTNEWVSDTPSEFRAKLQQAFSSGFVKSEILNLTCTVPALDVDENTNDWNSEEG